LNLSDFAQQLFNDIRDMAQLIAPIAAIIGPLMVLERGFSHAVESSVRR